MPSFNLFTDTSLSTAYGGTSAFVHKTDFSDNDQDFVLYLGSPLTGRQLQANSNPGTDNITLTPTDTLTDWTVATEAAVGDLIEPSTPNDYMYICVTAGTTDASTEPTWTTTVGDQFNDNGVIWECYGKKHKTTEIKLATTSAGLDSATAGAALSLGTTISSGTANKIEIHVRLTNAVNHVTNTTGKPNITLTFNEPIETAA
ncbi:hypothetical protein ACFVYJ_01585 [Pontibacter sp. JAM-7]|uniref:hypothetical protein n=1 Tax=Pontibacter sp. JAM-7 TaxID=3366581 RepID=UPI003AF90AF1